MEHRTGQAFHKIHEWKVNLWTVNSLRVFVFVFPRELRTWPCSWWAVNKDVGCTSIVILPNNENAAEEGSTV